MHTPDQRPIKRRLSARRVLRSAGRPLAEPLEPRQLLATLFVDIDAAGANNGGSWANAFTSLQSALTAAVSGDDIWVAEGDYEPGSTRSSTFSLKSGVDILGGFDGTETQASQRDVAAHRPTLNGFVTIPGVYHVVSAIGVSNASLDGFQILGGSATGSTSSQRLGGGIYLENSSVTLENLIVEGNHATVSGGGIYIVGGSPTISNSTIRENGASSSGGGIFINDASPTITNTAITDNNAPDGGGVAVITGGTSTITDGSISSNTATRGGGVFLSGGTLTLTSATISGNTGSTSGGGIHILGGTLNADADVTGNTAGSGGGIYMQGGTSNIGGATFNGNIATADGGGIYVVGTLSLSGYTVSGNTAARGGGIYSAGTLTLTNSTITDNTATSSGAGVYSAGAATISGTTFSQNDSGGNGGGATFAGTTTVSGSTFLSNTADEAGGGLLATGSVIVGSSTFQSNTAVRGAGAAATGGSLGVKTSLFVTNQALVAGGALHADGAQLYVANSRFFTNSSADPLGFSGLGGGIFADNSTTTVVNAVFTRNFAHTSGGAIYATDGTLDVINSTFVQNSGLNGTLTAGTGGAMTLADSITARILNSIIWMNFSIGPGSIPPDGGELQVYLPNSTPDVTVADSLVFGGLPTRATDGGGIFELDPDFIDEDGADNTIGTTDDNVRLMVSSDLTLNSPAIGAGNIAHLPADVLDVDGDGNTTEQLPIDLDNNGRIAQTTLDLGPYESSGTPNPPTGGNQAPVVGELLIFDLPSEPPSVLVNEILAGTPIQLVAQGVLDLESELSRTDFYIDLDGDGEVSAGDLNLGTVNVANATDADGNGRADTFTLNVDGSLTVLEPGTYTVLARAVDLDGLEGESARAVLVILDPDGGLDWNLYIGGSIAASSVADQIPYPTNTRPEVLDLADVNGDGIPDAVVTSENGYVVSVLFNNGDGTFGTKTDYAVGQRPEDVVVVDVDNDGDNDIVTANWFEVGSQGSLTVLKNNGSGAFSGRQDYVAPGHGRFFGIDAADFDGDGFMDIVTTSQVQARVVVWRNTGSGAFVLANVLSSAGAQERVAVGDFNGDGKPDITNGANFWLNNSSATGNFAFGVRVALPGAKPYGVAIGDLDNDGDLDIVRTSVQTNSLTVYLNNGAGNFTVGTTSPLQTRPEAIDLADVNGDGVLDAVVANSGAASVSILVGNEDGTFQPQAVFRVGLSPEGIVATDIGTDGTVDIVTSNIQDNTISVIINNAGERNATGVEDADGNNTVAIINQESDLVVFERDQNGDWIARRLDRGPSYFTGQLVSWLDPKDDKVYYAGASTAGLKLFSPNGDGTYTARNLSVETNTTALTPSFSLKYFLDIRGNIHLFGIAGNGDIVTLEQTGGSGANGFTWIFGNISQNLRNSGLSNDQIPLLTEFEAYTTRWDQWGLAGIAADGDVYSVWVIPGLPQFPFWRLDNLSTITGAPPLEGGLATIITNRFDLAAELQVSWDGINIGGLNSAGQLITLWWVPENTGAGDSGWRVNNLTTEFAFPGFSDEGLTSYFTPWGGINFAGLTEAGEVQVYWWVPGFELWAVSNITETLPSTDLLLSGDLVGYSAPSGLISIVGPGPNDESLRLSVDPFAPGSSWNLENLTDIAERVE